MGTEQREPTRLHVLEQSLERIGYRNPYGAVIREYDYSAAAGGKRRVDLMAFADSQRFDISTACIAFEEHAEGQDRLELLSELRYVGVPIALLASPNFVEVWPVTTSDSAHKAKSPERLPYKRLQKYLDHHKNDLSPRSLMSAKRGDRQLSFIDIDPSLDAFAREATKKTLVQRFTEAIASIPEQLRAEHPTAINKLTIWILAARILQDKLGQHHDYFSDFREVTQIVPLLETAKEYFPSYFVGVWDCVEEVGPAAVESFYEGLGRDYTFGSLTNDMLAYFYENTMVDPKMRREFGIYYTPQKAIAERILHRLPVEDLPVEKRTVFDGTCGSGNLLLASYDRLSNLLPAKWAPKQRHDYLLQHIWGVDIDPFACEIARLSLLLYNLPEGDSWKVKQNDVFNTTPQDLFGGDPYIIVGNPPFKEPRSTAGTRVQLAARVLDLYLEWLHPNGLLGVVVPVTFLQNASAKSTRNRLLRSCDVMEVWHLPYEAIPGSAVETAVILARKLPRPRPNASGRLARGETYGRLEQNSTGQHELTGKWWMPYVVSQDRWFANPQHSMESSKFDHIWDRIGRQFPTIDPYRCTLFNGVQLGKQARKTHLSDRRLGENWKPVLNRNIRGKVLQPFRINWAEQKQRFIKYPSPDLQWPRDPSHFEHDDKIVINATRSASSPWRIYAAVDSDRLVITENFHYALPLRAGFSTEIAAVLNSTLANAWYSSRSYQRKINLSVLRQLPFPRFTAEQHQRLRILVQEDSNSTAQSGRSVAVSRLALDELDDVVFEAYGLDAEERNQIKEWMNRFHRPAYGSDGGGLQKDEVKQYAAQSWRITGHVESIDPEQETVLLSLQGLDDPAEVPIPDKMPGWALRPDTSFLAITPWQQRHISNLGEVDWLDFHPLEYGNLTEQELLSILIDQE